MLDDGDRHFQGMGIVIHSFQKAGNKLKQIRRQQIRANSW